jgi:putative NADPH-quinone reductase
MNTNIYVIQGHPHSKSLCFELADAYARGAVEAGCQLRNVNLADLKFELSVSDPAQAEIEPDLQKARQDLLWADHIVFVYPIWWGSMPALLKGFLDRVLTPGYAFKMKNDSVLWEKLLDGRSARMIITMDGPVWHNHLMYGKPAERTMQKSILEFCGITPVHITSLGPVDNMTDKQKESWLQKVEELGTDRN